MGNSIKIAILSDLHCTYYEEDECKKFANHPDTLLFSNMLRCGNDRHPVQLLFKLLDKEGIKSDYLLCPGDITNKFNLQGLITGFDFLKEIKNRLSARKLFCTPGNHDLAFNTSKYRFPNEPLRYLGDCYPTDDKILNASFWDKHYFVYQDDNVVIACLDSTCNLKKTDEDVKVSISPNTIDQIVEELNSLSKDDDRVRLAMTHHHPIHYSNANYENYPDRDCLEQGENLLNRLSQVSMPLFIHGHKHIPRLVKYNNVIVFCAGGFAALQNIVRSDYHNSFHIVELNNNSGCIQGTIDTWNYTISQGWYHKHLSTDVEFPVKTGFGSKMKPQDLASNIIDRFGNNDRTKFSDIFHDFPDILFLMPDEQEQLERCFEDKQYRLDKPLTSGETQFLFKLS